MRPSPVARAGLARALANAIAYATATATATAGATATGACGGAGDVTRAPTTGDAADANAGADAETNGADETNGAGVPDGACGDGFRSDGHGACDAILPADPCPSGTLAYLGETACHDVAPCPDDPWGDVVDEPGAQYVDGANGGFGDGTRARPWATIGEGVEAAPEGGLVVVAAGTYLDPVAISHPVRIVGRCPRLTSLGDPTRTVNVFLTTNTSLDLRRVSLCGTLGANGGDVSVDQVYFHDSGAHDVFVGGDYDTSLRIRRSLFERSRGTAIDTLNTTVSLDQVVVRDAALNGTEGAVLLGGDAIAVAAVIRRSIVERVPEVGIVTYGTDVWIDDTLVRGAAADGTLHEGAPPEGTGIAIGDPNGVGNWENVIVTRSVVEDVRSAGFEAWRASVTIDASVIRRTGESPSTGTGGYGVQALDYEGRAAQMQITRSMIDANRVAGVFSIGSDVTLTSTLVRGTQLDRHGHYGHGVDVRGTIPNPGSCAIVDSAILDSRSFGVLAVRTPTSIRRTVIDGTRADGDGAAGDGIAGEYVDIDVEDTRTASSQRAGISSFGARIALTGTSIDDAAIDLDGETTDGNTATFDDRGANRCATAGAPHACLVLSAGLSPPPAISP